MDLFYLKINNLNYDSDKKYNKHNYAGRFIIYYVSKNKYNIQNPEIEIVNKKPKFKYSDIQFSISHSGNIACVCFSDSPVGVDIEKIKQRDYEPISKKMNFRLKDNNLEEFYKAWTNYEAEYKLQNTALSRYSFKLPDDYIISVVSNKTTDIKNELNIIEIPKNIIRSAICTCLLKPNSL